MELTHLHLKNFRCFPDLALDIPGSIILIEGLNGSGKTSLIEALHYVCYLRSFRTYSPRELVQFGSDTFFIRASFTHDQATHEIQVGFSEKKRLVKINQKPISSFKELLDFYRIVTLTEDDLLLINDGPEVRRTFIDQAITLCTVEYAGEVRSLRNIVDRRNALLMSTSRADSYVIWTEQLWLQSSRIMHERITALAQLELLVNTMLTEHFQELMTVSLEYKEKRSFGTSFDQFMHTMGALKEEEFRLGRSLFGAHLDDIVIKFQDKKTKTYGSRGQQKLVVLLLKIALIKQVIVQKGPVIFLLDDFMTDFDGKRAETLLDILLKLSIQLIFTYPNSSTILEGLLSSKGGTKIKLTH